MHRITSDQAELEGVLAAAKAMAVAARTSPKTRGVDSVETLIVYGDDLETLAQSMETHAPKSKISDVFKRDADNVRNSQAVLLVGIKDLGPKKMDNPLDCGSCGHGTCAGLLKIKPSEGIDFMGPVCTFQAVDLGIALSSAAAVAARRHVDNRMMYTIGGPARNLNWLASHIIIGIPLSCSGKNIYFDR